LCNLVSNCWKMAGSMLVYAQIWGANDHRIADEWFWQTKCYVENLWFVAAWARTEMTCIWLKIKTCKYSVFVCNRREG